MAFWDVGASDMFGGALGFLGGAAANKSNAKTAAAQMEFERSEAAINRQFQSTLAETGHQREVRDLKLAGLNPILSATGGPGAPMASGSKGSGAGFAAVDAIGAGVSTAQAFRQRRIEAKHQTMDMTLKEKQMWLARDQSLNVQEQTRSERAAGDLLRAQIPGARTEADIDRTAYGRGIRYADRIGKTIGSALGARRLFQQKPDRNRD